jgi:hypothetical protein
MEMGWRWDGEELDDIGHAQQRYPGQHKQVRLRLEGPASAEAAR